MKRINAIVSAFLLICLLAGQLSVKAQSAPAPIEIYDDPIASMLDSLANLRYFDREFTRASLRKPNKYNFHSDSVPLYQPSAYTARLEKLNASSPFDLRYHSAVKNYIELYTVRKRQLAAKVMGMSEMYFPLFEEMLDRYDLPLELKYLAIVESALNPVARSRAGAVGLWQFMYGTGKMYNLRITSYIDERRDPYKSTEAACEYLKFLYQMFGDWEMVLAAYNSGPGTVNKAIRRSGGKRTYWEIRPYLPRETQSYVPAFIAINYVMNFTEEHNLCPLYTRNLYLVDTVKVRQQVTFEQLSRVLNVPVGEIEFLNPMYRRGIIPYNANDPYILALPAPKIGSFIANEASIYNYLKSDSASLLAAELTTKTHVVRTGEHLSTIAKRYKCSVSELKEWNNLRSTYLRAGQKLLVYVKKPAGNSIASVQPAKKNNPAPSTATVPKNPGPYKYHTVQSGDTLWNLAREHGTTVAELRKLNNFGKSYNLMPGKKIKIGVL